MDNLLGCSIAAAVHDTPEKRVLIFSQRRIQAENVQSNSFFPIQKDLLVGFY
jgi:hypothetical protein